jgi:1-acyl-sn-glycerol-3-phosphate acyltransferase
MALEAQAPIVPVAISGAREAMRKGTPWIQPVTVAVAFGPPIETAGLTIEDRDRLVDQVRSEVARLLGASPARVPSA